MKILAAVFAYNRRTMLERCIRSVFDQTLQPDQLVIVDDRSDAATSEFIEEFSSHSNVTTIQKGTNRGPAHSWRIMHKWAELENPEYLFPIEADYVFRKNAFAEVVDTLEHTEEGAHALGIVGYDHPNAYSPYVRNAVFPRGMKLQMGADNVNRAALYRNDGSHIQLASNTCPTSYLKWRAIQKLADRYPEMRRQFWEVGDPQEKAGYPESGEYMRKQYIDDGMLSHVLNYWWNVAALEGDVDRERFSAWLNIRPSLAQNFDGGGVHSSGAEGTSQWGASPTWAP